MYGFAMFFWAKGWDVKIGLILTLIGCFGIFYAEKHGIIFWASFVPFSIGFYTVLLILWKRENDSKIRKMELEHDQTPK